MRPTAKKTTIFNASIAGYYFLRVDGDAYYPRFNAGEWLLIKSAMPAGPNQDAIEWLVDGAYRLCPAGCKKYTTAPTTGVMVLLRHRIVARLESAEADNDSDIEG